MYTIVYDIKTLLRCAGGGGILRLQGATFICAASRVNWPIKSVLCCGTSLLVFEIECFASSSSLFFYSFANLYAINSKKCYKNL